MCGWLRASMSGLTRNATRVRVWRARAIASIRSSSPSDSALMVLTPRSIACSSSAGVFPTPVKTICGGMNPARSATSISPPEFASARAAQAAQQPRDGQRRVRFQRVVHRVRMRGERFVHRTIAAHDRRGAVDVEWSAIGRGHALEAARRRTRACHRVAEIRSRNDSIRAGVRSRGGGQSQSQRFTGESGAMDGTLSAPEDLWKPRTPGA